MTVLNMPSIPLDKTGKPHKHWAGRTQAAKAFKEWVDNCTTSHVSRDEAYDAVGAVLEAYLEAQR